MDSARRRIRVVRNEGRTDEAEGKTPMSCSYGLKGCPNVN